MSNKYYYRSRILERAFREIIRFGIDIEATKVSEIMGINRPAINKIFMAIRHRIAMDCGVQNPFEEGEIELDESYFGANLVRGKRGREVSGKIPVFGMLKRNGKSLYTDYKELFFERNIIYNSNNNTYENTCIY